MIFMVTKKIKKIVINVNNLIFMVLDFNFNFFCFLLISTSSQLKIIALNRNNFLSTFFFFWLKFNFVCWRDKYRNDYG